MLKATRRTMLATAGVSGAAGALLGPLSGVAVAAAAMPRRSAFAARIGGVVSLRTPAGLVRARVVEVVDLTGAAAGDEQHYAVLLRPRSTLPDGSYRVSGPGLAGPSLFLANVDRARGAGLEAVVSTA